MTAPRLAVLADFPEEGWPSMDLCAEQLVAELRGDERVRAERLCPPFQRRFTRWIDRPFTFNADRFWNRFRNYPRYLRCERDRFDLFHVVDHSYAQLVHELPGERTGVYCHDLDAFRCLLEPARDPRPRWFRTMMRRALSGLRRARVVFHSTLEVRQAIVRHGLVDPARLVLAPYGAAAEFTPAAGGDEPSSPAPVDGRPFLLHVGSCIARKRIDVLLDVFAELRQVRPELRLVQVGGRWTEEQEGLIQRRGIASGVTQLSGISRRELAERYRRAAAVLLPSEAEGFGLPVIEALACGAIVVASDIPALREIGGEAALYCPVGDAASWVDTVGRVLDRPETAPGRSARLARARQFSWKAHAQTILNAYLRLLA